MSGKAEAVQATEEAEVTRLHAKIGYIVTTGRLGGRCRGVAVPVTDRQGRFALAFSISATAERLDAARVAQVAVTLRREAREFAPTL